MHASCFPGETPVLVRASASLHFCAAGLSMAKQKDYLADLLKEEEDAPPSPETEKEQQPSSSPEPHARDRRGAMTLLSRESALSRVASGEVRQVTQLMLDPANVGVWEGNARRYDQLTKENTRDLIDSIISEGGQKVPVIVRRPTGSRSVDYEVIAGTRRHFAISWLRKHSYPDMRLLAEVHELDDEASFRLADIENRARKDVSDLERAQNYAAALIAHYNGSVTGMAERLRISKGWLSKMLKVAALPDWVIAAFASPADINLKPAYPLGQAVADEIREPFIQGEARRLADEQQALKESGQSPIPAPEVIRRLLTAGAEQDDDSAWKVIVPSKHGHPALSVLSQNRQGVTVRLHAGSGASEAELAQALRTALGKLKEAGRPLAR